MTSRDKNASSPLPPDPTLGRALLAADSEVQAQLLARLEAEASLRGCQAELRAATRALGAANARATAADARAATLEGNVATLTERLSAVKHRNTQLERAAAGVAAAQARAAASSRGEEEGRRARTAADVEAADAAARLAAVQSQVRTLTELLRAAQSRLVHERALQARVLEVEEDAARARDELAAVMSAHLRATDDATFTRLLATDVRIDTVAGLREALVDALAALREALASRDAARAERDDATLARGGGGDALQQRVAELTATLAAERAAHEAQLRDLDAVVTRLGDEQALVERTLKQLHAEKAELAATVRELRAAAAAAEAIDAGATER